MASRWTLQDFDPEYREDDKTGHSFYKSDFDGKKVCLLIFK